MTAPESSPSSKRRVLVPIADGSEDIETTCITDILVRGGVEVTTASVMPEKRLKVQLARGTRVTADTHIADVILAQPATEFDAIILPGGMPGATHLSESKELISLLKVQKDSGKLYGAICASPAVALAKNGLLEGITSATCFPFFKDKLGEGISYSEEPVVFDKNCVTSRGPGTAMAYGISLVAYLVGEEKAAEVATGMLLEPSLTIFKSKV